jgi:hypothetical protein
MEVPCSGGGLMLEKEDLGVIAVVVVERGGWMVVFYRGT